MNAAEIAAHLLVYVDQRTLAEAHTSGAEYIQSAVTAINSAAQELYRASPSVLSSREFGIVCNDAITVTTAFTKFSQSVISATTLPIWTLGQSIIADSLQSRITALSTGGVETGPTYVLMVTGTGAAPDGLRFFDTGELYGGKKMFRSEYTALSPVGYMLALEEVTNFWRLWTLSSVIYNGEPLTYNWQYLAAAEPAVGTIVAIAPQRDITGSGTSGATITMPCSLPSASYQMTVYNDAIPISNDIISILPTVIMDGTSELQAVNNEYQLINLIRRNSYDDFGRNRTHCRNVTQPAPATPLCYIIQGIPTTPALGTQNQLYMRLSPRPVAGHSITFRAKVRPTQVTVAGIDAANNGAGCTQTIPMPQGWAETYLLPVALQHFTRSPFWRNSEAKSEIARAYQSAMEMLPKETTQQDRPLHIYPTL